MKNSVLFVVAYFVVRYANNTCSICSSHWNNIFFAIHSNDACIIFPTMHTVTMSDYGITITKLLLYNHPSPSQLSKYFNPSPSTVLSHTQNIPSFSTELSH